MMPKKYCKQCGFMVVYDVRSIEYSEQTGKATKYQHEWYCITLGGVRAENTEGHHVQIMKNDHLFTREQKEKWGLCDRPGVGKINAAYIKKSISEI